MIKQKSHILILWFKVWDLLLTAFAWVAAYLFRFNSGYIPLEHAPLDFSLCAQKLPLVVLIAAVAYRLTGQYQIHRFRRLREELFSVLQGTTLMTLLVVATTFGLHDPYESRATFILFFALTAFLILATRRCTWAAVRWLRARGYNQTHAIIVGTGRVARQTARALRVTHWLGIKNIGFVEDKPSRWTGDLDILGSSADLPHLIEQYQVSHVFICLPMNRHDEARKVFDVLAQTYVEVQLIADVPDLGGLSLTMTNFDGLPMIGLRESPHFGVNIVVKRAMDIVLSALALVLLAPLMLIIAALIKITSPGPVFFRQERCGLNGQSFQMLKFRSMRVDAEKETGAVWTSKDDPRRTRLGTFLRKTSLDELPQFINVLLGDMSLVGPRPERPVFIKKFSKTIPNYQTRHCVKAGITGWAQVNGWRGNTSLRKRIQYDLYYITHWTPWLDLRILFLTVWRGLVHRNAY
ncbi:MAG: undecaprenyl-phosphate glucose phosphotransferase [Gemmataceae bacterium]|nr:undecaprenyl-phosphate glucose phosphotransferase [Gemmataceae bacterium]MCI0741044.1 undecaprenyl-phosphate glucose phosphotransferase [Gemmataceae bacterium]